MKIIVTDFRKNIFCVVVCVALFPFSQAFAADLVPNTFSTGEVISASEMNANFNSLEQAINNLSSDITGAINGVNTVIRKQEDSSGGTYAPIFSDIVSVSCLSTELISGGSCSCNATNFNLDISNSGIVKYCDIVGNSVLGVCEASSHAFDINKYGPPVRVYAVCVSATTVLPSALSATTESSTIKPSTIDESKPSPNDEVLAKIKRLEEEMAAYKKLVDEKRNTK